MNLNKLLPVIFSPIVVLSMLILMGVFTRRRYLAALAVVALMLLHVPLVGDSLFGWAQGNVTRLSPTDTPLTDAVVLVGGVLAAQPASRQAYPEWNEAVDRIFGAVELIKAQRAPVLVISGGSPSETDAQRQEGEMVKDLIVQLGVSDKVIKVTRSAANTAEEARVIRDIFSEDSPKITLVTTAFHMRRAKMQFEREGFKVVPYPVDIRIDRPLDLVSRLTPNPRVFSRVDFAFREALGRAYYSIIYIIEDSEIIEFFRSH